MRLQKNANAYLATDVQLGEYVFVRSDTYGECGAYARGLFEYGLCVRVEIDDDHPAMRDAMADYPDLDSDNIELETIVPFADVERRDGSRPRVWEERITERERAARHRRRGVPRPLLPELDHGLRYRR